jgi:uncharacterized protein YqhQ
MPEHDNNCTTGNWTTKKIQVGGQAVLEGVMMRSKRFWAIAVRRPDKTISTKIFKEISLMSKKKVLGFFFIRGIVALGENLALGFKALSQSVGEATGDEVKFSNKQMAISVVIALLFTVGIFFVLPTLIGRTFSNFFKSSIVYNLLEGLIRIVLFLAYIAIVSLMKDIKRLFQYHGAEHKTIAAYEHGVEPENLNPGTVREYSRLHVRCGTSFLLIVMVVSILVFALLGKPSSGILSTIIWRVASRVVLLPVIAGISYELIRLAGKFSRFKIINIIFYPGLLLQRITTREPDDSQIEVAVSSFKEVLTAEQNEPIDDKIIVRQDDVSVNA